MGGPTQRPLRGGGVRCGPSDDQVNARVGWVLVLLRVFPSLPPVCLSVRSTCTASQCSVKEWCMGVARYASLMRLSRASANVAAE
ncbi:hypothetical protein BHM03_00010781 [Ensete ventricosum]|nr:hypothetical protein BHM03_00010781 [Ensete ventricosum]